MYRSRKPPAELTDNELLLQYARTSARRGIRNSGLVICLAQDPPEPDYFGEITRRMSEGRMNDQDEKTLRALYEKYGYAGVRGLLDSWDDEAMKQKTVRMSQKTGDTNDNAS